MKKYFEKRQTRGYFLCVCRFSFLWELLLTSNLSGELLPFGEIPLGSMVLTLCDKCLDRLRETLTQHQLAEGEARLKQLREKLGPCVNTEEKPEAYNGQIVLFTGTEFTATDKLGKTYRYRMVGAEVTRDGLIRLLNVDTGLLTYVEPAWFRERKIKVVQKEAK